VRFPREAEAVAALTRPNIVTIYSIEEDAGISFMTMELVEGQSVDRIILPALEETAGAGPVERR
jgi:serine/threonine protein kinase